MGTSEIIEDRKTIHHIKTTKFRWLATPKEELGGRTPVDLILEERKALGNPQEEVGFSVQFNQLEPGKEIVDKAEKIFNEGTRMLSERKRCSGVCLMCEDWRMYRFGRLYEFQA